MHGRGTSAPRTAHTGCYANATTIAPVSGEVIYRGRPQPAHGVHQSQSHVRLRHITIDAWCIHGHKSINSIFAFTAWWTRRISRVPNLNVSWLNQYGFGDRIEYDGGSWKADELERRSPCSHVSCDGSCPCLHTSHPKEDAGELRGSDIRSTVCSFQSGHFSKPLMYVLRRFRL